MRCVSLIRRRRGAGGGEPVCPGTSVLPGASTNRLISVLATHSSAGGCLDPFRITHLSPIDHTRPTLEASIAERSGRSKRVESVATVWLSLTESTHVAPGRRGDDPQWLHRRGRASVGVAALPPVHARWRDRARS